MRAEIEHMHGVSAVTISGRLDTNTAPLLDAQLLPMLTREHPRVLLDLAEVTYISSAGLRSILRLIKHTAAHGSRLGVCAVPPHIMEVIEISGFPTLLDIYPDRESALNGCSA
jgi:anti-anti-sigma factor